MPLTEFQQQVCRLISKRLRETGEGYIAGGVALNKVLKGGRISRDIDLFHDTLLALESSWARDKEILAESGLAVEIVRDAPGFKEAFVSRGADRVLLQWTRDSAFRFFPLVSDDLLGLTLHPFDLATNKVLALAGRLEPRDWVDVLECHDKIQPFGYLVWAACGKDPGFNPSSLLSEARRSGRYTQDELDELSFAGNVPDAGNLGVKWHGILKQAEEICDTLKVTDNGVCVLEQDGNLCCRLPEDLKAGLKEKRLLFHRGSIKGAFPAFVQQ